MKFIQSGLDYIAAHPEVRDVILSGGDPLMLTDVMLEKFFPVFEKFHISKSFVLEQECLAFFLNALRQIS